MKFFFLASPVKLTLAHKVRELNSPTAEQLHSRNIPADRLYCGNVAWEIIHAKRLLGEDKVHVLQESDIPPNLLPTRVSSAFGIDSLRKVIGNRQGPVRIALLNGFGTMLGDTALGCGALLALHKVLNVGNTQFEFHAFASWNARPGVENMLESCPAIHSVQPYSPTLKQLREFDAYVDFSSLLSLSGYGTEYYIDFYLKHLGFNPGEIDLATKKPWFKFDPALLPEAKRLVRGKAGRSTVLVHPNASTPLRSMPADFTRKLVKKIVRDTSYNVVFAVDPGFDIKVFKDRVVDLSGWSAQSLQHLGAIVQVVDQVVSVDTLIIHLSNAADKPCIDILTASHPVHSVRANGCIQGVLLPGAESLPGWMKHKAPDNWKEIEPYYHKAWAALDTTMLVDLLRAPMATG